ncbi:MAG: hypothetical protein EU530_07565, partial [Promethearchaeota archaeon]
MKSQVSVLNENWKVYSKKLETERLYESDDTLLYQGRRFYDIQNPPFIASIVKIAPKLWEPLQIIQADLEIADRRQTYFHPNYFHITLNEFGWQDQVNTERIIKKMKEFLQEFNPFDIKIQGINCFERIIFAQVFDETKTLESIFTKSLNEFPQLEKHFPTYIPHISLVKIDTSEARDIV